jgi:exodeoxyribonuclease-3
MKILSWNVNGLRACARKGFLDWLKGCRGRIVAVQEVRAREEQLEEDLRRPPRWRTHFVAAERPGYSGVGLFSRMKPDSVESSLGAKRFDVEGRLQMARFGKLLIVNSYFPNGNGKERDNSRIPYKLAYYRKLFRHLEAAKKAGERILVLGDLNTAHEEIDLARPKQNVKTSGFCPEERAEISRWLRAGWVDTFRQFEKGPGHYTWWSQRGTARERNVGWRLDYVLASPGALPFVRRAFIQKNVLGSDHCPVGVDLDPAILE